MRSGLPIGMQRSIYRLVERQFATLLFAGFTFATVLWLCGYRQGGPLSGLIFVIAVAPFLAQLAALPGINAAWGFCDDWEASMDGIWPVRGVRRLVEEFEAALRESVGKSKMVWLPNRPMNAAEQRELRRAWPDALMVDRVRVLGTPLGRGVVTMDFIGAALENFQRRIVCFSACRLSLAMRVLAVNMYLYPLFAYVTRALLLRHSTCRTAPAI